jgi:hypothetical protein
LGGAKLSHINWYWNPISKMTKFQT